MEKEIWKFIQGFENYLISNFGRVKNLSYNSMNKEQILKPMKNTSGYLYISLYKNGIRKNFLIHKLVAEYFLDNPLNLPEINHKDENKLNNHVDNIEYCDRKYNNNYGNRIKLVSKPVLQYDLDGNLIKEWKSTSECGKNGFCQVAVCRCCNGLQRKHKNYIWIYK